MIKRLISILSFIIIAGFSFGQSISDTTYILNQVNIKANRSLKDKCITKTEIDTIILKQSVNTSLSDLLVKYSPVFIKTYGQGSMATASFRGTAASHTQVEWNGINLNNPMIGQVDFSLIPIFFIDEISLLHGGSSMHKSSGALGGSVIINSLPSWHNGLKAGLVQSYGSFNTWQSFLKLSSGSENMLFDLRVFHEQSDNDFKYYNNANGLWNYESQLNAQYKKTGALLNSYFRINQNNFISLNIWGQLSDRNLPAIMSYEGTGRDENQQDYEFRISGKWKFYKNKFKSELNSGYSLTNLEYYLANNSPLGLFINYDSHSRTQSFYNRYTFDYKMNNDFILSGMMNLNYHNVIVNDDIQQTGYNEDRIESGVTISLHKDFFNRLSSFILLKTELTNDTFSPIMPSMGFEYEIFKEKNLFIKTNLSRNYHQPNLNDLYWIPGGNPNLKPEQGYTADIGLDYFYCKDSTFCISTSLNSFYSKINDWIIWRPGEYRYWQAENIQEVFARGIEGSISLSKIISKVQLSIFANYSYTRTTNQSENIVGDLSVGQQLIYIPVHKANTNISANYRGFDLSYSINYTGQRYTTASNLSTRHSLPAYLLHDITISKDFKIFKKQTELQFRVNNILNTDYQAVLWRAMPGRNYKLIFKISL